MLFPIHMNKIFFLQLVFNASMLLSLAIVYDLLAIRWRLDRTFLHQVPSGLIIGLVGIILMQFAWRMAPGIVFDTRSILLGVSGLYFGVVPTAIAMTATAAYRCHIGGAGVGMGIAVIVTSGVMGIAWGRLRREHLADMTWRELLGFGLAVHLVMLLCIFFLPETIRRQVLKNIALPATLIYPAVTAMLGKLMAGRFEAGESPSPAAGKRGEIPEPGHRVTGGDLSHGWRRPDHLRKSDVVRNFRLGCRRRHG